MKLTVWLNGWDVDGLFVWRPNICQLVRFRFSTSNKSEELGSLSIFNPLAGYPLRGKIINVCDVYDMQDGLRNNS